MSVRGTDGAFQRRQISFFLPWLAPQFAEYEPRGRVRLGDQPPPALRGLLRDTVFIPKEFDFVHRRVPLLIEKN